MRLTKQILLIIVMTTFMTNVYCQDKLNNQSSKEQKTEKAAIISESNGQKIELTFSQNLIDTLSEKLESSKTPPDKYGVVFVAIVALFGAVLTTLIGTYASIINLKKQIKANEDLEYKKKKIERDYEKIVELKDTVAKFILNASLLNTRFYAIINHIDLGQKDDAEEKYKATNQIRNELLGYYYSIKVALDGSKEQLDLEKVLNDYMNLVQFKFDVEKIDSEIYNQLTGELYHKIKAIIHENYSATK